jgi:hypothetical protein
MDKKTRFGVVAGLLITLVVFFINIYAAGIVFVILLALVMTYAIMQDSRYLPDIVAEFREDAKGIVIRNAGNATAQKIHVALVPENIEYDIGTLLPDAVYVHPLDRMVASVRVVVTFENENGDAFTRSYQISSLGEGYDPLKPMIPLFGWK